jgi:hypothetical protein
VEDTLGDGSIFNYLPVESFGLVVYLDVPDDVAVDRLLEDEPEPEPETELAAAPPAERLPSPLRGIVDDSGRSSPVPLASSSRERAQTAEAGVADLSLNIRKFCASYRQAFNASKAKYDAAATTFIRVNGHGSADEVSAREREDHKVERASEASAKNGCRSAAEAGSFARGCRGETPPCGRRASEASTKKTPVCGMSGSQEGCRGETPCG